MIDWTHWHNEPYLVGGLIMLGWLYAIFTGPLRPRLAPGIVYPRAHAIKFYAALVIFYLAVGSPLDQIGERFLLGLPDWLLAPVTRRPTLQSVLRLITHPVVCALLYTLIISVWHAPALYDWALQDKFVHVIEHVLFFTAALFYWWPVLSPSRDLPRIGYGAQMIYLLSITIGMTPLFAFLAFADNILYPTYEYAPRIIANFSPAQDQLLGAAIMKLGGLCVTLTALIIAFYRWYQESEKNAAPRATRAS